MVDDTHRVAHEGVPQLVGHGFPPLLVEVKALAKQLAPLGRGLLREVPLALGNDLEVRVGLGLGSSWYAAQGCG